MNLESVNEVGIVLSIEKNALLIAGAGHDRSNPQGTPAGQDLAWDVVERFIRQAPVLSELGDLIGQALRAVRDAVLVLAGRRSSNWRSYFVDRLVSGVHKTTAGGNAGSRPTAIALPLIGTCWSPDFSWCCRVSAQRRYSK